MRVTLRVNGARVELAVSDTGVGISAPDRERLFTRFFRAGPAAESSIQGVGLGLSITKSIVESHGGRIEVRASPVGAVRSGCGCPWRRPTCGVAPGPLGVMPSQVVQPGDG